MVGTRRVDGGILAGQLLIAGGLLTLLNVLLPSNAAVHAWLLWTVGAGAVLIGALSLRVPWRRLPPRAPIVLALLAFGLISVSNAYGGGINPFSYAIFYVVVFVWAGIAQPPGTSLLLAAPAVASYLAPMAALPGYRHELLQSVTVAIPVFVLVGEVLARATRNHQRTAAQLSARVHTMERLASISGQVGRDLEPRLVGQTLTDCAAELFDGRAVFARVDDGEARIIALHGLDTEYIGYHKPVATTSIGAAASDLDRRVAVRDQSGTTMPVTPGGCVATVACFWDNRLIGALTVLLDRPVDKVDAETLDVLRVLGGQGEIALSNAHRHSQLVAERQHEEAIVNVLVDGVVVLGPDGRVRTCNEAAAALFGWEAAAMVGQPMPLGVEPGESVENEIEPGKWIETSAALLPESGEVVVALRDVSRQHALDAAKDLFLATTSHELRTPLTAIKGYISTLQRHWTRLDDGARRRALEIVEEETDALVRLTDHLLLGARAATTPRAHIAYDLGDLVRVTAAAYSEVSAQHMVVPNIPSGLPHAVGDPDSVRSILAQLVENAVKYSPGGGVVEINVGVQQSGDAPPDRLVIDVLDRGVGLPVGTAERLFEPFSQGDAPNTRTFSGVGLGLYIVRRLVETQGGEVVAQHRPGGGSDFRFTIPVAQLPSPRRSEPVSSRV